MFSYSRFEHHYTKSLFKYVEPISEDYRVFVNGEEIPVYTCRVSKYPFNRVWPGHQRSWDQTEQASFVNIVSDEELKIEVIVNRDYENVMIRPYSKGITHTEDDGKITFTLKEEGQVVLACDDLHSSLFLFNSKPIVCPDSTSVTYYFGPGIHMPGKIILKGNESLYVDKDALVFGCICAENVDNIHIFGNGLFDDRMEERLGNLDYESFTNGNMRFYECNHVKVEGVLFRNSAAWCVSMFHCFDVELDNIKVFGQWRYNTDGVDIVNSQDIVLKNSFIHSFDDTVTIKGIDRYAFTNNEDILTENCILWCDWGKTCELGLETACREYKNIVFRNCDIIRGGHTALDIQNGDCAEISAILFENINVEYNSYDNVPQVQIADENHYDVTGQIMVPALIRIANWRYRESQAYRWLQEILKDSNAIGALDLSGIRQSTAHDITFRNIHVYYDEKIPKVDGKFNIPIYISSSLEEAQYYNISVSDVWVNGKAVTQHDLILDVQNTDDFSFTTAEDAFGH